MKPDTTRETRREQFVQPGTGLITRSNFRRSDTEIRDLIKIERGANFNYNTRTRIACVQLSTALPAGNMQANLNTTSTIIKIKIFT